MLLVFLLKGIVVGIVIAVPVGPVGVLCVRRTIFQGKLAGFVSGLGAATAAGKHRPRVALTRADHPIYLRPPLLRLTNSC